MTPPWVDKLKRWEKGRDETLAKALMAEPTRTTILKCIPFPGVVLIMGARGSGKTGLAYETMSRFHGRRRLSGAILTPRVLPRNVRQLLPDWVQAVADVSQLPRNAVVVIDEAAQMAHARRSQSALAISLDNLVSMSRQRRQLILFLSHHSRKLDVNLVHDSDRIIWKQPTEAHALFERDELQLFTRKALAFFEGVSGAKARMKATYVMDLHHLKFYSFSNRLPRWWHEQFSSMFESLR